MKQRYRWKADIDALLRWREKEYYEVKNKAISLHDCITIKMDKIARPVDGKAWKVCQLHCLRVNSAFSNSKTQMLTALTRWNAVKIAAHISETGVQLAFFNSRYMLVGYIPAESSVDFGKSFVIEPNDFTGKLQKVFCSDRFVVHSEKWNLFAVGTWWQVNLCSLGSDCTNIRNEYWKA